MEPQKLELTAIATFYCDKKYPFDAARQGTVDQSSSLGEIRFHNKQNFNQALEGIEEFSHLWLIYQFHHNQNWKPKVMPPRGTEKKIGVFATRAPYRPNPLGLSCVELVKVDGLSLWVKSFDLLDGSPIFDVKPYVSYADSFPQASLGWLENHKDYKLKIHFSQMAQQQIDFIKENQHPEIANFITHQLETEPFNDERKRLEILSESKAVLAYRTWRIAFEMVEDQILVSSLHSGYSEEELCNGEDKYQDKNFHKEFKQRGFL